MIREYRVPLYGSRVKVVTGNDRAGILAKKAKLPGTEDLGIAIAGVVEEIRDTTGLGAEESAATWIVYLNKQASMNTVAHEAFHVVGYIAKYHGIHFTNDEDEHLAYLMGWVMEVLVENMNWKVPLYKKIVKDW